MNGYVLKMIAIITMFIDHTAAILIPSDTIAYLICRSIGRLAFPIFCFLLVEGFIHTSNVKRYLLRLGLFALISEIPFDLAFSNKSLHYGYILQQNIFFTLFIGLAVICFMSIIDLKFAKNVFIRKGLDCLVVVLGCVLATVLATDYEFMGVLLIVAFYVFRFNKFLLTLAVLLVNVSFGLGLQVFAALSMLFILFYNGKRGHQGNKYIFYIFYPAHILLLYFISLLPIFN
ncbi:TraX family protein [Anaerocolumna sp. MB42-C2]|uniref:TraX family protein n=1 Tax=Anaerocolumna sp. MB42-C2 TaxID=3070997 RepID=UPI0027E1B106|nr:TraX family protein [Anaerocolumna sp. MB42-C2]WMJ87555.1 TraX family protein [Anaerocolumna sp. MB42-C2]